MWVLSWKAGTPACRDGEVTKETVGELCLCPGLGAPNPQQSVMSVIICLSSFVCHWHWADHMCASGVGWRHLGAKHSGILFAEVTGLQGPTGIWRKRSLCIGLEKMNSSQLSLALVVEENHGQLWERGNQSKSLAFDFLIHRFWELRNHGRRWTLLLVRLSVTP